MTPRFEELIERHHDEICAYLWRLMGKDGRQDSGVDIEDLTQDVFLRAYESFPGLRPNSNYRAWLYKIATHSAYTQLRRMKHRREKFSFLKYSPSELAPASDDANLRKYTEQRVRAMVNRLPAKQNACITLRYLQDLDYPEIAQIIGCSEESARANVYQAIRHLRLTLEEKDEKARTKR